MWNANGSLSENVQFVKVADASASGTGDVVGDGIELGDFRSVVFFCEVGTADPSNALAAEISVDDGTTWTALAEADGTPVSSITMGDHAQLDCRQPTVGAGSLAIRPKFSRGVASTLGPIYAALYDATEFPTKPADGWERVIVFNGK